MHNRKRSFSQTEMDPSVPQPLGDGADLLSLAAQVLLEDTQDAVFVLDAQERVVALNPAARQLVRSMDRSVLGQSIAELFASWPKNAERFHSNQAALGEEIVVSQKQAADRQFLLRIRPLQRNSGQLDGRLAVLREITNVKQMAAERDRAHAIAEAARKDLFVADRRLADMERLKSDFIANVSHQLRTPVANLHLYLYLLQHGPVENQKRHFDAIQREVIDLEQLVGGILDFSRWEEGREAEGFEVVDLNQLVEQLLPPYQIEAESKGIEFTFDAEATSLLVRGKPTQLEKAIMHLLDNALAYTQQGTITVRLSMLKERRQASLVVEDTGTGIHSEDLPYLFKRFYRGLAARTMDKPGIGLGLSLVKQIISMHGGNVQVESQVDKGTLFRIQLPMAEQG